MYEHNKAVLKESSYMYDSSSKSPIIMYFSNSIKCFTKLVVFTIILATVILFLPGLPPHNVQFTTYSLAPTKKLQGPLKTNTKLNKVEKLFEDIIKGPESVVHHDGILYTGIVGGSIIKIQNNTLSPFVKFGKPCGGTYEEHICGRPLGLFIDTKKDLYATDAYHGIFKVNISTGEFVQLVHSHTIIDGRKTKFFNSVFVAVDGTVYWTDSDSNTNLNNIVYSILFGPSGRLVRYDPISKTNSVLMDDIHFANGLALAKDESFVLVVETVRCRILRYYLKGPKKGTTHIFVDGLPGYPDNLKRDEKGNFYVSLIIPQDDEHSPYIFVNIGKFSWLRKLAARFLALVQTLLFVADNAYPSIVVKQLIREIGYGECFLPFLSQSRTTIVKLDKNGAIIDSLHAIDNRLSKISDIEFVDEYAYLGSPVNRYLARVKLTSENP